MKNQKGIITESGIYDLIDFDTAAMTLRLCGYGHLVKTYNCDHLIDNIDRRRWNTVINLGGRINGLIYENVRDDRENAYQVVAADDRDYTYFYLRLSIFNLVTVPRKQNKTSQ